MNAGKGFYERVPALIKNRCKNKGAKTKSINIKIREGELLKMKNIQCVKINDLTNYDSNKCFNGGCYAFTVEYNREKPGDKFIIEYNTSSEFDYCNIYGSFQECRKCAEYNKETNYCFADYLTVTEEQLKEIIEVAKKQEEVYIEIEKFS